SYSFDAYGWETRADPRDAYRFARGEPLGLPPLDGAGRPSRTIRLERPLDFAAVTDHSEYLGEVFVCTKPGTDGYDSSLCQELREGRANAVIRLGGELLREEPTRIHEICGDKCSSVARSAWQRIQEATEQAYDRSPACAFTTFHAYEWSAN